MKKTTIKATKIKARRLALLLSAAVLACGAPLSAKNWTVDSAHSSLGFIGTEGSTAFTGSFKTFHATIDFDPAKPETGKITTSIDMRSATAGSEERDSALPGADWFNTAKFPDAEFVSTSLKTAACDADAAKLADKIGCFEADGTLTIKDYSKPVTLLFALVKKGDGVEAIGKAPLVRTDFGVGQGGWSDENYVRHAVVVTFDLNATPAL